MLDAVWACLLLSITYADAKKKRIPDCLTAGVFLCGMSAMLFLERREMLNRIGGLGISLLVFFIILFAAPGSFGGGDVKLSAANGLYLGARLWIRSFVAAVLLAGIFIVACTLFKRERWKEEIAFGPYLCLGAAFAKWL